MEKKVLYCFSSNRLSTKFSRHICSFRRKTIYFTTIPLRHRKLLYSEIILALGNFYGSTYYQVWWLYIHQQPFFVVDYCRVVWKAITERSRHSHALKFVEYVTFMGFFIEAVWQTRLFCTHSINREWYLGVLWYRISLQIFNYLSREREQRTSKVSSKRK